MQEESSHVFKKYVGTVKAKAQAEQRLSLGNYSPEHPAKGFSIKLSRENDDDSVSTDIITSGSAKRYELTLQLTNHSGRAISAEVWGM